MKKREERPESLTEISVEVLADQAERVEHLLANLELPEWHLQELRRPDGAKPAYWLKGIFPDRPAARAAWKALRASLPPRVSSLKPDLRAVRHEDWANVHKQHFKPWSFSGLHWVPIWERDTFPAAGEPVLWLDPGMAFGTGNHETTRLCVERLIEFAAGIPDPKSRAELSIIDAGTGSGILALSAAKLGFRKIFAFDNDPEAVRTAEANAHLNQITAVDWAASEIPQALKRRKADLLLANIQADVLQAHSEDLLGALKPGGLLVLSGLLAAIDLPATKAAFEKSRPKLKWREASAGEWASLTTQLPG